MNPLKYAQMMKYLTRAKKEKPDLPDVFPASEAPIPPVREDVETMDAINAFVRRERQQKAGGGMLVQPGFGGVRQGYREDKLTDKYKETEAYKKKITPKGYIGISELIESVDNPKLKLGNFQQARKFERNPKKYPGKKNYVYNYIKKLLNEKQVGKAGSESLAAQKFFYKKPTKAELDKINSFIDSRILETGTVDNVKIFHKEFGKLFEGKKTKGFFNDTLSLNKARAALKKYKIKATDSQLARAMMRLGQIYDGHTFQNEINIPKNKSAGKFIEKSFNELDIYNGWRSASYDAAMDDINKVMSKSAGDIRNFKYTLNNYIKENYPQIFKNYDVNEIFSLTTSSVRGSYPYSYFIDLTKNDINQKALSSFQGKASIAEGKIKKAITNFRRTGNQKFYNEAIRVADVFNNTTRKNFLSDERIIKVGGVNALKLEIGSQQQIKDKVGFASEYYKKNNLKKWKDQGIDIDAHTAKSGYVKTFDGKTPPRGVATFGDIIQDGKVNKKQFNTLLASLGDGTCAVQFGKGNKDGGRIGYATGPASLSSCLESGARNFNDGKLKTADQVQDAAKLLRGGRAVLSALSKYGIVPELAYVGLEAAGRTLLGEQPTNALLKSIDTLTFGATDFTSEIEAEKFGEYAKDKLAVDKFQGSQAKVRSILDSIAKLEQINLEGGETDVTQEIATLKAQLQSASDELKANTINPDTVQFITQKGDEIADAQLAKSSYAKQSLTDQLEGFPGVKDYLDTEDTRVSPFQQTQKQLNEKVLQSLSDAKDIMQYTTQDAINLAQAYRASGEKVSAKDVLAYRDSLRNSSLSELAQQFNPESVYGAKGVFSTPLPSGALDKKPNVIPDMEKEIVGQTNVANPFDLDISDIGSGLRGFAAAGGGIAKLAGIDQGPPPVRGPNSQGLQGLLKRGIKI
jgi:hypothetical protein